MKRLHVYLHDHVVGFLDMDNSGLLEFQYTSEWLTHAAAVPLSRSLPLEKGSFQGGQVRPFFAGILPDEGSRRRIAGVLGISERNDFDMLWHIGGECAGAVSLLPESSLPPGTGKTEMRHLTQTRLQEILTELPRRPLMAGVEGIRLSLAGSRDKLPVILNNGKFALPLGNTPSTHILKPEPDRFPGLVANEVFCMKLALKVGLNVPEIHMLNFGNRVCIMIKRYDRVPDATGTVRRIHQEDFCQALGLPPEKKYQQEGGPLIRDCIGLLCKWSTVPVLDIPAFMDALIFNVLIANADAHGKNYSMLYPGRRRVLAPLYDLVCTAAWPELSDVPAMKIGKSDSMNEIRPEHWKKMAVETGIGWPMLRERLRYLGQKTLLALKDPDLTKLAEDSSMALRIAGIIKDRATLLIEKL